MSKIDDQTSFGTKLDLSPQNLSSSVGIGYRKRTKNYEVNSSVKTNGGIKSLFSYKIPQMFKLKLFLAGNLFKDDFKTGYSISIGAADD